MADNPDMDISPGDSTPTSEASYSLTGTPTIYVGGNQHNDEALPSTTVVLPNALPRLASHPNASSSNMTSSSVNASSLASSSGGAAPSMHYPATCPSTATGAGSVGNSGGGGGSGSSGIVVGGATMLPATGLATTNVAGTIPSTANTLSSSGNSNNSNHRKLDAVTALHQSHMGAVGSPNVSTWNSFVHVLEYNQNFWLFCFADPCSIIFESSGSSFELKCSGPTKARLQGSGFTNASTTDSSSYK